MYDIGETDRTHLPLDPERQRLAEAERGEAPWYRWGPYLSARQWGTVREDYSDDGDAWNSFTHDMSRYRAYRWGEDGLLGISDESGTLCFAPALWNGADPVLKERPFGLSNHEGNHGEDVKEYYYFLDNTPTHSYMKALYKYPQRAFPYEELARVNGMRSREEPEYELLDTGVFDEDRYFDVVVEYAKAGPDDIVIRISAVNRGPEEARLHLLPIVWFRNTWSWGRNDTKPVLGAEKSEGGISVLRAEGDALPAYRLICEGGPELLFTENETNTEMLCSVPNRSPYVKDGFHRAVVAGEAGAVNPEPRGTKAAAHYAVDIPPGETWSVLLRLTASGVAGDLGDAREVLVRRREEADTFFAPLAAGLSEDESRVMRQSLAGLLWSKQYYNYNVREWLAGDPAGPAISPGRRYGRNHEWRTLVNDDVISMPDTWEYPWYAAWDLAFHCVPLALVDSHFAKRQLMLLLRESYMRPDGQIPAYEWAFSQVNPPVFAWAALKAYRIEQASTGVGDADFLERIFHKLLLHFTWWVNRKDREGRNVFEAGFLGLDNIGVFNRDASLPTGGYLQQADATAWMGMFCLNMLDMALELARERPAYEDIAYKFFEHYMYIAGALNDVDGDGCGLWDADDGFFYDCVRLPDGTSAPLKVRSLVGLIPLAAVLTIEPELLDNLPSFRARLESFLARRPDLASLVSRWDLPGDRAVHLLTLVHGDSLKAVLQRMLDPDEFLSDYGIRSLSRRHLEQPYSLNLDGEIYEVYYDPGAASSPIFGGNSNWRGPIWFPTNYLLIDALRGFHQYYGDDFLVEYPSGSGSFCSLKEIANDLAARLTSVYLPDSTGLLPAFGHNAVLQQDPHWRDYLLFFEYFHGDTAEGLGASHQTGWTALIAIMLREMAEYSETRAAGWRTSGLPQAAE